ncbi:class I SAM-dependent methyltransferase [Streptomyces sp. NPDC000151]|uniref:class I SAM-dependent DNA methyltransferase n=1 Tax=Streptomyces sp. NPDC000151 TaxID=3154244 RepID=UPI00331C1D42
MDSQEIVDRSHSLDGRPDLLSDFYGDWATTYESDASNMGYEGPLRMADFYLSLAPRLLPEPAGTTALDAGCGTGLIGPVFKKLGIGTLDGLDLNHDMVTQAAGTGAYRHLTSGTDLNLGLPEFAADTYDLTVSCGVFTTGHVAPHALDALLRVTRPDGVVLLTTSANYLTTTDFHAYLTSRQAEHRLTVLDCLADHRYLTDERAHYWAVSPTS